MALNETTLSSAMAIDATTAVFAAVTNLAIGMEVRIDGEEFKVSKGYVAGSTIVPLLRGQGTTVAQAHSINARVVYATQADFQQNANPQTVGLYVIAGRARVTTSIGAAGAIPLPPAGADALVWIMGTALALTLAAPTKDLDGTIITLISMTGAAHAITMTGFSGGSLSVATFDGTGKCAFSLIAVDETWVPYPSPLSGTLTSIDVAMT